LESVSPNISQEHSMIENSLRSTHSRRRFLGGTAAGLIATQLGGPTSVGAHVLTGGTMSSSLLSRQTPAAAGNDEIREFSVEFAQAELDDLSQRLVATRLPSMEIVADASQGVQQATVQELIRYWSTEHDWRATEAKLNALPQFVTEIDGVDIHFIHVKSKHENALPLLITHGWPGSILEMLGAIGPLTDPTNHGGKAEDAFDVVIPSIPGFGFSEQPLDAGWNPGRVAAAWAVLMNRLGYSKYVAQGGDVGAGVTDALGRIAPDGLAGIHLNFLSTFPLPVLGVLFGGAPVPEGLGEAEAKAYADTAAVYKRGYLIQNIEHPQTLGYAQADSPAGLAAWMLDHDTDSYTKISQAFLEGTVTGGLTPESVVDNIALYWLTNTGVSAARIYWEIGRALAASGGQQPPAMALPAAYSVFPGELIQPPREWLEQIYPNLTYFNQVESGGHFPAWEAPDLFAAELRAAFASVR
jgi:pimeloyl-ACP methyl ester carboxylesterase